MSESDVTSRDIEQPQPAATQAAPAAREPVRIPFINVALPGPISALLNGIDDQMQAARKYALRVTPAPLVNLNSNVNGILHVAAELVMFKASGVKYLRPQEGKEVNYLIDPPRNLFRAMTGADKDKALQNHWSSRSTMAGFGAWTLGSVEPDKLNSDKEIQDAETMAKNAPLQYAGKRLFEAVQIGNPDTKRQQIGLGVLAAGAFSAVAGFHNVNLKTGARFFNWSQTAGGIITSLAASQLLFATSDKKGWQHFGNLINWRIPLLTMSIIKKQRNGDRWGMYAIGQALFQGAGVYSYLYGGAQKLPDGTIIEHEGGMHGGAAPAKLDDSDISTSKATPMISATAPGTIVSSVHNHGAAQSAIVGAPAASLA